MKYYYIVVDFILIDTITCKMKPNVTENRKSYIIKIHAPRTII